MRFIQRLGAAGVALSLMAFASVSVAQAYPAKPIQLVVAFAPGGAGDVVARLVAKRMGESMGQPVVIDNRPVPVAAVNVVAHAKPDGYTLLMAGSGTALTSALFTKLPYDLMGDFVHVSTLASFDLTLITSAASGLHSVADVVAFAKANPGKLNIGTARVGSTQNVATEMFKSMAGIDAVIVPYKTTGDLISAVRAKDVQVAMEMLPAVLGQVHGKSVKALAVTSTQRFAGLPDVPTLADSGVPGFEAASWNGIAVPLGTPPAVVSRLAAEVQKAVSSPELQKELQAFGAEAKASTPEQMRERMQRDIAKWRAVIDKAGIPRQ
jgi:tripartite-type tricarboxylate transporter receptor subunit TctC